MSKYGSGTAGNDFERGRYDSSGRLVEPAPNLVFSPVQDQPTRRVQAALFGGSLADAEGSPQALVIYHYYESLTTCEEDEEVQVIRTNLLTFLRWVQHAEQQPVQPTNKLHKLGVALHTHSHDAAVKAVNHVREHSVPAWDKAFTPKEVIITTSTHVSTRKQQQSNLVHIACLFACSRSAIGSG